MNKHIERLIPNAIYFGAAFALSLLAPAAFAHTGIGETGGFLHGFQHPIGGVDHVLAMVAVGLWAAQLGGRAVWAVPTAFVGAMVLGGALGISGVSVPFIEQGIVFSVVGMGLAIAAAVRFPLVASMAIVGLFAIFHGHAHGTEMPANAAGWAYGIGFAIATALLHLGGIGMGLAVQKLDRARWVRVAGGAIALSGLYLMVGR